MCYFKARGLDPLAQESAGFGERGDQPVQSA
jgi:hypothetical protein